jgi:hypothetical protein
MRLLAALLLAFPAVLLAFTPGDFVSTSRRAQFHGSRTQPHDLLGHHCPRFGHSKTVALPLPKPVGFLEGDEYKLSLAFDGDRLHTPWLKLIGAAAPKVPIVDVELLYAHGTLLLVHAATLPVPPSYTSMHAELVAEFRNASAWPKHVLVHYRWRESSRVDLENGLYALLLLGLLLGSATIARATLASARPLGEFFYERLTTASTGGELDARRADGGRTHAHTWTAKAD